MVRTPWLFLGFLACKSDPEPAPHASAPTPQAIARTVCAIQVTGDTTASWVTPGGSRASTTTDYWLSDQEIRTALEVTARALGSADPAALARTVDQALHKDPRLVLLMVTCGSEQGSLVISASPHARYADVPFAPKRYAIRSQRDAAPGELVALFSLQGGGPRYAIDRGMLDLTRFDATGLAGTLAMTLTSAEGKTIEVTGTLDYPCAGQGACRP